MGPSPSSRTNALRPPHVDALAAIRESNMRQLIALRWLAVVGQFATIMIVYFFMGVALPVANMLGIILLLVLLNLVGVFRISNGGGTSNGEMFFVLLLDVAALTSLLYLSGGVTNPFIWLFLVQVVLSAILLDRWSTWAIVWVTSACFLFLLVSHQPLILPPDFAPGLFDLYFAGALTSFILVAMLLALFVTRINANLRTRDHLLATMRQQAAEEDHIVRMGMLATGAAHEFGTPLATLSVIANDWGHRQDLLALPEIAEELDDIRRAVDRCKSIVSGILTSAGEVRGEKPTVTTLVAFLQEVTDEWRTRTGADSLHFDNRIDQDIQIISDVALKQVIWNLFDNAREASDAPVTLRAECDHQQLQLSVFDRGPGFQPEILRYLGQPYRSTKDKPGGGLGLFLVVNVIRKMGGRVDARNAESGGAVVTIELPLSAISWTAETAE